MSSPDRLYMVRSQFYIANFETCIQEANRVTTTNEAENLEKTYFVYRSMICLGQYSQVLEQIRNSPTMTNELKAIALLAQYFAEPEKRADVVQQVALLLNDEMGSSPLVRIIACTVYNNENDYDHAYTAVQNADSLEELSVLVYTLVRMNRPDKASEVYAKMCKIDEDHVLSQLAKTWINANGVGMKENTYIYRELMDKLNESAMLVNNYLLSDLRSDDHVADPAQVEKCFSGLMDEYGKDPKNPVVLRNLVVVMSIMHKPEEEIGKYLGELEAVCPADTMVTTVKNMSARLQQLEKEYV
ncbi:epsilon coatomer [Blastocystis sp. ATCC 50177/Nand II]|uniref:Epsilon coatomer n=1 Tax=Blastocystis sp. subtype 1 (strain ATCC 50177 / NandII) TaxID=478820 RepID=A0A196S921_BLAHN|nr:epsilon coatomer [Blastocystis sp. ATCC 50177/Nand II]